jgi:hypothetical protein
VFVGAALSQRGAIEGATTAQLLMLPAIIIGAGWDCRCMERACRGMRINRSQDKGYRHEIEIAPERVLIVLRALGRTKYMHW